MTGERQTQGFSVAGFERAVAAVLFAIFGHHALAIMAAASMFSFFGLFRPDVGAPLLALATLGLLGTHGDPESKLRQSVKTETLKGFVPLMRIYVLAIACYLVLDWAAG